MILTRGKFICSFPGPAIEIPNDIFSDAVFRTQLVNFLVCMNEDDLDNDRGNLGVGATAFERGETVSPCHITELLTGILRGVGHPATVVRVSKRVGDDDVSGGESRPWRRSPLWLVIRVAIQTTLESSPLGREAYRHFIIFLLARLADPAIHLERPALLHVDRDQLALEKAWSPCPRLARGSSPRRMSRGLRETFVQCSENLCEQPRATVDHVVDYGRALGCP